MNSTESARERLEGGGEDAKGFPICSWAEGKFGGGDGGWTLSWNVGAGSVGFGLLA